MNQQEKLNHHLKRINKDYTDQETNMRRLREIKRLKNLIKQSTLKDSAIN